MKITVIGGSGFLGSYVADILSEKNHNSFRAKKNRTETKASMRF